LSRERASDRAGGAVGRAVDGDERVTTGVLDLYIARWSQAHVDMTSLVITSWRVARFQEPNGHAIDSLSEPAEREAEAALHVRPQRIRHWAVTPSDMNPHNRPPSFSAPIRRSTWLPSVFGIHV
jgi:hypothetical protein